MSQKHSDTRASLSPTRLGITFLMLAAALVLMPALAVRAGDYVVANTNASGPGSLHQAILDANSNPGPDTITFSPDVSGTTVLTAALPAIDDDLTITGPGAENLAISGDDAYRVFEIDAGATVTITGVTVRDGMAASGGGGGIVSSGDLYLGDVHVLDNAATGEYPNGLGGGVRVVQGTAVLSGTLFSGNSALYGGGMGMDAGTAALTGVLVHDNSASVSAGGIAVWAGTLTAHGGEVNLNTVSATGFGGGVAVNAGTATLNSTMIYSNSAGFGGGGFVWAEAGRLTINGGKIGLNSANYDGGGVYLYYGRATLNEVSILYNFTTGGNGGGVAIDDAAAQLTVSGGEIKHNSAFYGGGGVHVSQGSATLNGTRILHNTASSNGGGLYLASSGSIAATGGCIVGNSATSAHNGSGGTVTATDNWWGAVNGPGGEGPGDGDSVSVNVNFGNFKTMPLVGCPFLNGTYIYLPLVLRN